MFGVLLRPILALVDGVIAMVLSNLLSEIQEGNPVSGAFSGTHAPFSGTVPDNQGHQASMALRIEGWSDYG